MIKPSLLTILLLLVHSCRCDDENDDHSILDEMGGVSIKVFRGPSQGDGAFAPFGYYVKMPVGGAPSSQPEEEQEEDEDGYEEDEDDQEEE